jgi:hypothetical protein
MPQWQPGRGDPIVELYAYIATEPNGGQVPASAFLPVLNSSIPLVSHDLDLIRSWRTHAQDYRKATGCGVRLMRFSLAEGLEELP